MRWFWFSAAMGAAWLVATACRGDDGGPNPAESASADASTSWAIRSTQPGATASEPQTDAAASNANAGPGPAPGRFLHVALRFDPAVAARRLHRFRITDASGRTVAEPYGYYDSQSRLVFERTWEKLDGLYLDGLGRRVPLAPASARAATPTVAAPASKPKAAATSASSTVPSGVVADPSGVVAGPRVSPKRGVLDVPAAEPPPRAVVQRTPHRGVLDTSDIPPADAKPLPAKRPVIAGAPPSPAKPSPAKPSVRNKLYQELIVAQTSKVQIQGLDVATAFRYRVLSSLEFPPGQRNAQRRVLQTVEAANLLEGDAASRALMAPLLTGLVGAKLQIDLDRDGRVARLEGDRLNQRVAAGPDLLGGQGLVLASLIDRDGWKEISELTFFQPQTPFQQGRTWQRDVAHSWGPLGRWNGPADYVHAGKQDGLDRVTYRMALKHSPPTKTDGNLLPFELANVAFKHDQAGGALFYDPKLRRVVRAEETFHVRGSMEAVVLGQRLPLVLDERQQFFIRVTESPETGSTTSVDK